MADNTDKNLTTEEKKIEPDTQNNGVKDSQEKVNKAVEEKPEDTNENAENTDSNETKKEDTDNTKNDKDASNNAEDTVEKDGGNDLENKLPDFNVGDKIVVNYRITEGKKTRIQPFEGLVIARKGSGVSKTFTVRRIGAANIGVERIFPLYSPNIDSIVIKSRGKVRRAKLYYLRDRVGKAALKVKEKKVIKKA